MEEKFLASLKSFAERDARIESVIIVGSYARGTNTPSSDLDLCILTPDKPKMVGCPDFIQIFGPFSRKQTEYYGACTSIRVWYDSGLEVEFGLVEPSWASLPLEAGTKQVLADGYRVLVDKKGYFKNLCLE